MAQHAAHLACLMVMVYNQRLFVSMGHIPTHFARRVFKQSEGFLMPNSVTAAQLCKTLPLSVIGTHKRAAARTALTPTNRAITSSNLFLPCGPCICCLALALTH